jgi:hypothetical protein
VKRRRKEKRREEKRRKRINTESTEGRDTEFTETGWRFEESTGIGLLRGRGELRPVGFWLGFI